jgi:hypothetical protein
MTELYHLFESYKNLTLKTRNNIIFTIINNKKNTVLSGTPELIYNGMERGTSLFVMLFVQPITRLALLHRGLLEDLSKYNGIFNTQMTHAATKEVTLNQKAIQKLSNKANETQGLFENIMCLNSVVESPQHIVKDFCKKR